MFVKVVTIYKQSCKVEQFHKLNNYFINSFPGNLFSTINKEKYSVFQNGLKNEKIF